MKILSRFKDLNNLERYMNKNSEPKQWEIKKKTVSLKIWVTKTIFFFLYKILSDVRNEFFFFHLKRSFIARQHLSSRQHFTVSSNTIQWRGDLVDKTMINHLITQNKHWWVLEYFPLDAVDLVFESGESLKNKTLKIHWNTFFEI